MTSETHSLTRRTALKKGGVLFSTLAVGFPAINGTAAAVHIPTMFVDVPPVISTRPKGSVTTVIYPGGGMGPEDLLDEVGSDGGFKLGPHDEGAGEPDPEKLESHADAVRWRLVDNGVHGKVLGVFFDASTADEWFTSDDSAAKVSAVKSGPIKVDEDIIAWGFDEVTVNRDGSEARRF